MNRFFCKLTLIKEKQIILDDPEQFHHLNVLRLSPGEKVVIFDEQGNEYLCAITGLEKRKAVLDIVEKRPAAEKHAFSITIAVAIPKKSKIDDIIDKLTQVGADRVIPMITERVIVRAEAKDLDARHARWEKIAAAAALQSQRNRVPCIDRPVPFARLLEQSAGFDLKLIPTLAGDRKELRDAIRGIIPKNILALIGPEGDFSPDETAAALRAGFIPVSFGTNVLRVETAAVYITSILAYEFQKTGTC
jgi:16S rRNA (uracil1498-N3)-methyltransferase